MERRRKNNLRQNTTSTVVVQAPAPKLFKPSQALIDANNRLELAKFYKELETGVKSIFEMQKMSSETFLTLYKSIETHCNEGLQKYDSVRQALCLLRPGDTHFYAAEQIYEKLQEWIRSYIIQLVLKDGNDKKMSGTREEVEKAVLRFYIENWDNFCFSSVVLNSVFDYFNRFYVKPQENPVSQRSKGKVYKVHDLAIIVWRDSIFECLKNQLCNAVLSLIREDRKENEVDTSPVSIVISSLIKMGVDSTITEVKNGDFKSKIVNPDLSVYISEFECKLLEDTQAFYRDLAAKFLHDHTPVQYMQAVEGILAKEINRVRVSRWYHPSTESKIIDVCRKVLIEDKLDLIYTEFRPLLESRSEHREADLKRLYALINLLDRREIVNDMVKHYEGNVASICRAEIQNSMDRIDAKGGPEVFVQEIIKIFDDNKRIVGDVFLGDQAFGKALYKAVQEVLRENPTTSPSEAYPAGRPTKTAELMARYCDLVLKDKGKGNELDKIFTDIAELYQLLQDKDVFIRCLTSWMATRLTQFKSASDDAEESLLSKIRLCKNNEATNKLARMFQEHQLSREQTDEFNKNMEARGIDFGYVFTAQTICAAVWPLRVQTDFTMPPILQTALTEFQNFYSAPKDADVEVGHVSKFSGRKLTWLPALSSGEIKYRPEKGSSVFTFQCSAYQMAILLLFETRDSMTLDEILEAIGVKNLDIVKQLASTFCHCKLLETDPPYNPKQKPTFEGSTRVSLNKKYTHKKLKLNINMPLKHEAKEDEAKQDSEIEEQRLYALQALIVRLMKTSKGFTSYTDIVTRVMGEAASGLSINFKPQPRSIQKAVETLIDQEYLQRDNSTPDNFNMIAYVA